MKWPLSVPLYPCETIREKLYDALEGSLPPLVKARFRLHLRFCAPCRAYLALYRQAADMGSFRRDNPPPTALMDRTLEFLESRGVVDPEAGRGSGA